MSLKIIRQISVAVISVFLVLAAACAQEVQSTPNQPTTEPVTSSTRYIGFMGARSDDSGYSFFVMKADGTGQVRLAPGFTIPSSDVWSPDRTTLAYLDEDFTSRKAWFSTVRVDGSDQHKIVDFTEFKPMSWSWSSDGKKILMLCSTGGKAESKPEGGVDERYYIDIFSMDVSTGEISRLTDTQNTVKFSPLSSPDGKKIAFSGIDNDPATWKTLSYGIYTMDLDGGNQVKLFDSQNSIRSFQWSPDGLKIAYSAYNEQKGSNSADIYVLDLKTGTSVNLTGTPDIGDMDAAWSPDGKKIAFCSGVIRQGYHVRVMNADGTGAADLYDLSDYPAGFTSWAPDGKTILFTDRQSIYSIGAEGKDLKTILDGKNTYRDVMFPVWLGE